MTLKELEARVAALEKTVQELQADLGKSPNGQQPWWISDAGRFANDPVFDEIVRLGKKWRDSQVPDYMKKKKKKAAKKKTATKKPNARA